VAGDQLTTIMEEERARQEYVAGLPTREGKIAAEVVTANKLSEERTHTKANPSH